MPKIRKTPLNNDTGSRVELTNHLVMIKLPTSLIQDAKKTFDGLHGHQQENCQLQWDQGPSKASLQVTNRLSGIHGISRPLKSSNNKDSEKRRLITQHLVLLIHAHQCSSKDKDSVKNCRTVQTEVSTYIFYPGPSQELVAHVAYHPSISASG